MKPRRVRISHPLGRVPAAGDREGFEPPAGPPTEEVLDTPGAEVGRRAPGVAWLTRALLATAVALAGVYAVTAVALNLFLESERVRSWVEPRASAALNRVVTVGAARIAIFPRPSLQLTDVTVDNPPGFEGPSVASMDAVRLDVAWTQLIFGRPVVRHVHLERPRLNLVIDEDGDSNFGDLVPQPSAGEGSGAATPFGSAIRRVTVSHGRLTYFDASRSRSFMVTESTGRADLAATPAGGWRADIEIASDSLLVRLPSTDDRILRRVGPTARFTVYGRAPLTTLGVEDGYLAVVGDTLLLRGEIAGLQSHRPTFDIRLTNDRLSDQALEAAFPSEHRLGLLPRVQGDPSTPNPARGEEPEGSAPDLDLGPWMAKPADPPAGGAAGPSVAALDGR